MPRVSGTAIRIYKGETLPIEVSVFDSARTPAVNLAIAKFVIIQGSTKISKEATIEGSTVSVELTQAETLLMNGVYTYEFRVKDASGDVDSLVIGSLHVEPSPIDTAI